MSKPSCQLVANLQQNKQNAVFAIFIFVPAAKDAYKGIEIPNEYTYLIRSKQVHVHIK